MNLKKHSSFIKVMLVIFFSCLLNFNLFGYIWANYSPIGFCEECEETTAINNNIIAGGGYFLSSYSTTLSVLERIEWSDIKGIDYGELGTLIDQAIFKLKQVVLTYSSINALAGSTPYNQEVIKKLANFDYNGYQEENRLNSAIFNEVSYYLENGDVRGFYSRLLVNTEDLLKQLNAIKLSIDSKKLPEIRSLWRLNQSFSETLLFGQYAAEIFSTLQ